MHRTLEDKLPEWEANNFVPTELIGEISNYDRGHRMYGMEKWTDLFSKRQLIVHATCVESFHEVFAEECVEASEETRIAMVYLAIAIDKLVDWNSRMCTWELSKLRMAHTFANHNYSMKWSFAEMSPLSEGLGLDWVVKATGKCLGELITLLCPTKSGNNRGQSRFEFESGSIVDSKPGFLQLTCKSGEIGRAHV